MRNSQFLTGKAHPFIVAELGVNHDGSVQTACVLAAAAREAGADAIKMQYFQARRLLSRSSCLAEYQRASGASSPVKMLEQLELRAEEMRDVVAFARDLGLACIVTAFCPEHLEQMQAFEWDAFKIASPDIINRPLLDAAAASGRAVLVSTGTATATEVARSAAWLCDADAVFLQCVSAYPTPIECASIGAIRDLQRIVQRPVGYSDHTTSIETGAIAVAAGACILEKHLTIDRAASGPDHAMSLDPEQFLAYVRKAREAALMLGGPVKRRQAIEEDVVRASRQSIVSTRAIAAGKLLAAEDLTIKRPGTGLEPWRLADIVGARAARDIPPDTPLQPADIVSASQGSARHIGNRTPLRASA